jgi:hypothetical protein
MFSIEATKASRLANQLFVKASILSVSSANIAMMRAAATPERILTRSQLSARSSRRCASSVVISPWSFDFFA